ncbi:MAG: hypothetical protein AAF989_04390 [Planctomycetota bacterium]
MPYRPANEFALVCILVALVGGRLISLSVPTASLSANPMLRSGTDSSSLVFVSRLEFDPQAAALLWVGPDGMPGQRDLDDNFNGVVDDPTELGAVHSDDRLVTPVDQDYNVALGLKTSVPISHGCFVVAEEKNDVDVQELTHWRERRVPRERLQVTFQGSDEQQHSWTLVPKR